MDSYKLSRYNIFFERNDNHYLWNTFSGALIKLDLNALNYCKHCPSENDGSDYFNILEKNGCIVKSQLDELGKILYDEKSIVMNRNPSRLYFTIAPGLGCNYSCSYCFENHRTSFEKMNAETQEQLFNYLCSRINNNKYLERISITWFGGEPLLYIDIIYSLSKRIIAYCDDHGIQYYSGIITNGRFLTKENVILLQECRIGHIQISIDGMEKQYCKQKKASPEDFAVTIQNICYAADFLPIAVRINVFDGEISDANKLTKYLLTTNKLDGKIKVYIAHVREYDSCLSAEDEQYKHGLFIDSEIEFFSMFKENGQYLPSSIEFRVPKRRGSTCLSVCNANACIGPNGEIYQCEHHFGIQDAIIGTIEDGLYYQGNKLKYLSFEHYSKCLECSFFPVCLGGCLDDKVNCRDMINCKKYCEQLINLKLRETKYY